MLLQPIVENSLKHGLASKLEGGEIQIRTELRDGRLIVEVEDNGVGIPESRMPQVYEDGIGISNVHERLRVLYGNDFKMEIISRHGEGTRIRIEVPEVVPTLAAPF
jgi:two-component system LytT family sensor kinase